MKADREPVNTLLIEDDAGVAGVLSSLLKDAPCYDYRITTVPLPAQAIILLHRRRYDLIITDLGFPTGIQGEDVVKAIRDCTASTPLVVMSGNGGHEMIARCREAGADAYVPKGSAVCATDGLRAIIWNTIVDKRAKVAFAPLKEMVGKAEEVVRKSEESPLLPPYDINQDKTPSDDFRKGDTKTDGIPKLPPKDV